MPRFVKYNDAVCYRPKSEPHTFTWNNFTKLIEDIKATSGYRTVVFDTAPMLYSSEPLYRDQPVFRQIVIPEEWRNKE